jgi:hypothetical protein
MPMLAGVPVPADLVRELAERVDESTAGYLEAALDTGRATFALTIEGRKRYSTRSRTARTGLPSWGASCCASTSGGYAKGSRTALARSDRARSASAPDSMRRARSGIVRSDSA